MRRVAEAWIVCAIVACSLLGCARELDDSTPEGALALFVDALQRSAFNDPRARQDAFELLDAGTRRQLSERARSAAALGSRVYEPWEMLVEGRTLVRFAPRRGSGMRTRLGPSGDTAVVTVSGEESTQRVEIAMRLEDDGWRVVLAVPEVRAAREAPDDGATARE